MQFSIYSGIIQITSCLFATTTTKKVRGFLIIIALQIAFMWQTTEREVFLSLFSKLVLEHTNLKRQDYFKWQHVYIPKSVQVTLSIAAISIEKCVAAKVCIFGEKLIVAKTQSQIYIQMIIFHSNESSLLAHQIQWCPIKIRIFH